MMDDVGRAPAAVRAEIGVSGNYVKGSTMGVWTLD